MASSALNNLTELRLDEKINLLSTTLLETFSKISPLIRRTVKEGCVQQWYSDNLRSRNKMGEE